MDRKAEQGKGLEPSGSIPAPTGRGHERWSWKGALIGAVVGVVTAIACAELLWRYTGIIPGGDLNEARVALYPLLVTMGGLAGFAVGGNYRRLF